MPILSMNRREQFNLIKSLSWLWASYSSNDQERGLVGEKYNHAVVPHLLFAQIDCLGFCLILKPVVIHNLFLNSLREKAYLWLSYNTGNDIKLCHQDRILSHIMSDIIIFQFGFSDQLRSDLMIFSDRVSWHLVFTLF